MDLIYRRTTGAVLRVQLGRGWNAGTSRFFRETGRTWQAQERELQDDVVESEAQVEVDGNSRSVTVATFAPRPWAARTGGGAPLMLSLEGEDWPLDDVVLVQAPPDAFPVDDEDVPPTGGTHFAP